MIPPALAAAMPWKWIGLGLAALLAVAAVGFAIKAYGNARYDAGVTATDAKWKAAAEQLRKQSEEAAEAADKPAAARAAAYADRTAEEQKELDDAMANGEDPFDVLFPAAGD